MGRLLIIAGIVLIVLGLLWQTLPLFRLPGDFRYEGQHIKVYIPLATCIIISIVLTLIFNLFKK